MALPQSVNDDTSVLGGPRGMSKNQEMTDFPDLGRALQDQVGDVFGQ